MPDLFTFHHSLRTPTATGHRVHSIKLTTRPDRTQIVRDLVDKASNIRKPLRFGKGKRGRVAGNDLPPQQFPVFEPGMTTMEYINEYERLGATPLWDCSGKDYRMHVPVTYTQPLDTPAPMLDPALPEVWEEMGALDEVPEWLR